MPAEIIVREAKLEDSAELASVHLNAWREAYQGILPDSFLDTLPQSFRGRYRKWQDYFSKPSQTQFFVVDSGEYGVVGFVAATRGREDRYQNWGEIGAIYLLKTFQGKGYGYALLQKAFGALREQGFSKVYCWVLESNPTRKFYERSGGKIIPGEVKTEKIGDLEYQEVAYAWQL